MYPFKRSALSQTKESKCVSLAERTGLQFIPLYSTAHQKLTKVSLVSFSTEQIARFEAMFEEGCDLPDEQINRRDKAPPRSRSVLITKMYPLFSLDRPWVEGLGF